MVHVRTCCCQCDESRQLLCLLASNISSSILVLQAPHLPGLTQPAMPQVLMRQLHTRLCLFICVMLLAADELKEDGEECDTGKECCSHKCISGTCAWPGLPAAARHAPHKAPSAAVSWFLLQGTTDWGLFGAACCAPRLSALQVPAREMV